jgi:AraC-like DNA-binding protein
MELAKALLDTTGESVKAIAERLGYRDSFAFSHAFKAVVGAAPSKWREVQHQE